MKNSDLRHEFFGLHCAFMRYIDSLSEEEFMFAPSEGKWTAGQQLVHIARSIGPLKKAFSLPNLVLILKYGKANRPSRTFDEVVAEYQSRLSQPYDVSDTSFAPNTISYKMKNEIFEGMKNTMEKLSRSFEKYTEKDLDTILLPHSLIGKITLREMMYITNYHVTHHHKSVEENLKVSVGS